MAKKKTVLVEETEITVVEHGKQDYISLTDIAKGFGEPRIIIQNWMRARNTVQFLGTWETINNPDFNRIEFDAVKSDSGTNAFSLSPSKWIETTNAKGMISKSGRHGSGTFAHKDLAFGFCYWLSPSF
ncbi:MAG: KilA-N domain-containing protein [Saprospiraceae bacterium]|nr:KilA-N domain-containing protein [Saprospiraceae bacterium]